MKERVRVALIGAGNMANNVHYPSLVSFGDVDIVGLCDLDAAKREATARKFGISQTFANYREMLEQTKPDAVYALMPPHLLFDLAMDVMGRGHHLFVEKPPAVTTFQARSMARLAHERGLVTSVGFQRRYHPLARTCWTKVREKGPVHQVVASFYKNMAPQEIHPYYRGAIDILHCDAIHALDALRYYCGLSEVSDVASEVRRIDCWYDVSFNAIVHFENDAVGVLLANWRTGRRLFKFEFHACGASAYVDIDGTGEVWTGDGKEPAFRSTATEFAKSQDAHMVQGFWAENRAFIDAVKAGKKLHNSIEDSVKSMELADLIYQNAINVKGPQGRAQNAAPRVASGVELSAVG